MLGELVAGAGSDLAKALLQTSLPEELSSLVVFDADGAIILGTTSLSKADVYDLISLFNDREEAMKNGIEFGDHHFNVHRFHPESGLIYGRMGNNESGQGVCLYRHQQNSDDAASLYAIFTYSFPTISARAISLFLDFSHANLSNENIIVSV